MNILYVSDLDGTLLNKESALSEKTKCIINRLTENGLHFTFATARSLHSAMEVTKGLRIHTPLIIYNGAFIVDPIEHKPLYSCFFKHEHAVKILHQLLCHEQYPFVYAFIDGKERVSYVKNYLHEGGHFYLQNRRNDERFRCVHDPKQLYEGDIFYISCIYDEEALRPQYDALCKMDIANIVFQQELYRKEYWLELMPRNVSKASAIAELKIMGKYNRIVRFGDALNDIAMFSISDECYAVSDAMPQLKEYATGVIGSNQDDAVALWLQEQVKQ